MPLDPKFNKFTTASPVVATYDFKDLASGTGYENLWGAETDGGDYVLIANQFKASVRKGGVKAGVDASPTTITYELTPFNTPRTINGTLNILYNFRFNVSGGTTSVTVNIYKNADIISTGTIYNQGDSSDGYRFMDTVELTRTNYAKGDVLKISLVFTATDQIGLVWMHNPAGEARTFEGVTFPETYLKFEVPFDIIL